MCRLHENTHEMMQKHELDVVDITKVSPTMIIAWLR